MRENEDSKNRKRITMLMATLNERPKNWTTRYLLPIREQIWKYFAPSISLSLSKTTEVKVYHQIFIILK